MLKNFFYIFSSNITFKVLQYLLLLSVPFVSPIKANSVFLNVAALQLSALIGSMSLLENVYKIVSDNNDIKINQAHLISLFLLKKQKYLIILGVFIALVYSLLHQNYGVFVSYSMGLLLVICRIRGTIHLLFGNNYKVIKYLGLFPFIVVSWVIIFSIYTNLFLLNLLITIIVFLIFLVFLRKNIQSTYSELLVEIDSKDNAYYYLIGVFGWIIGIGLVFLWEYVGNNDLLIQYGIYSQLMALIYFVPSTMQQALSRIIKSDGVEEYKIEARRIFLVIAFILALFFVSMSKYLPYITTYFDDIRVYLQLLPYAIFPVVVSFYYYFILPIVFAEGRSKELLKAMLLGELIVIITYVILRENLTIESISFIYGVGLWVKSIYLRKKIEYKLISKFVFLELVLLVFFVIQYFK